MFRFAEKEVKVSNAEASVTRWNNGTKLVRDGTDTLHAIYRTNFGAIYHAKRKDGPSYGWSTEGGIASGDVPAIDCDFQNRLWVVDRVSDGQNIDCQYHAVGATTWTGRNLVSCGSYAIDSTKPGAPSIAAADSDAAGQGNTAAYAVYALYNHKKDTSFVVFAKVNTGGVMDVDTLDRSALANDSFPTISLRPGDYLSVAWQKADEIYYKTAGPILPGSTSPITWSNGYNLSGTPNAQSRHPCVASARDTVAVAWAEGSTPVVNVKRQTAGAAFNSWGSAANVSAAPDTASDYPTLSLGDSTIIAFQKKIDTLHCNVWASVNFHTETDRKLNLTATSEPGKYGHVVFELHADTGFIHTVWTEELTANYHEMAYRRYDLTQEEGGGQQSAEIFDPSITPDLFAPKPNPFRNSTAIQYAVNTSGLTSVKVFDLSGRTVRTLTNTKHKPGRYSITWNRTDDRGKKLSEGVYFIRLSSPNCEKTRKAVIAE